MPASPHDLSWKTWLNQHGARLLLYARHCTRSAADAEDVLQDAFVRFWKGQRTLGGDPLALLLTSVRRAACDRARREQRRGEREQAVVQTELFEPLPPGEDNRRLAIEAALARLPAEQREVLTLKIWGERTFEQIAVHLDIPANTAASRYRYALTALRKELTPADCHG